MLGAWWQQWKRNWMDYPLREGKIWAGRYRIEQFIGMGSYGQAYRCTDLMSDSFVLMKRGKPSKRDIGRKMLKQESEILQRLDHPQIPKWLNDAIHRHEEALIMELVEGDNLEHSIMESGLTYTEGEALRLVRQLLDPLKYLHEAGYVHRDVRTPNVVEHGGRISLIDFGLTCRIGEVTSNQRQTDTGDAELSGFADSWGAVRHRMRYPYPTSDLYGLGHLFLFLMYAGYVPDEGQGERGWEEELAFHPLVKNFIRGLLEDKWQSAVECEQELDRILKELS
ncbi:MAG: serine/threonine protein kinase [Candidatus Pristimantibacillus sp.]